MISPSLTEFEARSRRGNLIPVYREILADLETPVSAFLKIGGQPHSFLLESVAGGEHISRYSFIGGEAFMVLKTKGRTVRITRDGRTEERELEAGEDPLHVLKGLMDGFRFVEDPELPPFCGGAVGYSAYDTVRFFERLPDQKPDDLQLPDCYYAFTDTLLIFDHVKHRIKVLCLARVDGDPKAAYQRAVEKIEAIVALFPGTPRIGSHFGAEFAEAGYVSASLIGQAWGRDIPAEPELPEVEEPEQTQAETPDEEPCDVSIPGPAHRALFGLLMDAILAGARAVALEPGYASTRVRFLLPDGILHEAVRLPSSFHPQLVDLCAEMCGVSPSDLPESASGEFAVKGNARLGGGERRFKVAAHFLETPAGVLVELGLEDATGSPLEPREQSLEIRSNMSREEHRDAVLKAKEYIAAGDIIQVVLSRRMEADVSVPPFQIYRALRSVNPSPYMFFLQFEDCQLIGASPEILVTERGGEVVTRPIAGTIRRGKTPQEDAELEAELLADPKERAEHIMLVDLHRNDIGRVCEYGSVRVDQLMVTEKYSHVIHIVSNVVGRLRGDKDGYDLIRATFPAGTLSGAPKIRAMEIIEELEPNKRGPYGGVIGYFSFNGNLDTAITLRTIVMKGQKAYIQAGGGIVADSDPDAEYQETVNKAGALVRALELAERGLA